MRFIPRSLPVPTRRCASCVLHCDLGHTASALTKPLDQPRKLCILLSRDHDMATELVALTFGSSPFYADIALSWDADPSPADSDLKRQGHTR
jgi:hypothetical protein